MDIIASGSPIDQIHIVVDGVLRRIGFPDGRDGIFRAVVSATEAERPKPAPDVYRLAAGRIGLATSDCLAFEDSEPGVAAATSAGVICALPPAANVACRKSSKSCVIYVTAPAWNSAWKSRPPVARAGIC